MAKTNYVITSDDGFAAQLQTFKNAIGRYATMLGVSPAQVTAQAADADAFQYVLACQAMMRDGGTRPPAGARPLRGSSRHRRQERWLSRATSVGVRSRRR